MPKTVITPPGTQTPIAPFSPGTLADGVVYVSGTLAFTKDNQVAHVGDAEGQTRAVLTTIKSVIETAGGTMDDVTFNQIFLKSWDDYAAMNKVYAEFITERPYPVRATVVVKELLAKGLRIEMTAMAVLSAS